MHLIYFVGVPICSHNKTGTCVLIDSRKTLVLFTFGWATSSLFLFIFVDRLYYLIYVGCSILSWIEAQKKNSTKFCSWAKAQHCLEQRRKTPVLFSSKGSTRNTFKTSRLVERFNVLCYPFWGRTTYTTHTLDLERVMKVNWEYKSRLRKDEE